MREHTVSVVKGATCPILDVSFEAAVASSRLSESAKRRALHSVASEDFGELWNSVIRLAGPKFDPISLGRKMANGPIVPIFLACTCAPNLRIGLERVARYKALFGPMILVISKTKAGLRLELRSEPADIDLPMSLAIPITVFIVEKVRNHSAREINPIFVSYPAHDFDPAGLVQYFGCALATRDVVALEFTEKDASTRFVSENEALWLDVERELEQQLQEQNSARPFHEQVESAVRAELYSGVTQVESVCTSLRISRSTLQRRLREEGYRFQEILDRVRFELAVRYLTKSDFAASDISRMIGFMDPKSFFRAFRKKFGMTPEAYRASYAKA